MDGLFKLLRDRVDDHAKRAVEVYVTELPEYRAATKDARTRSAMLDFAVLLRRREAELAATGEPFSDKDLAVLTAFGAERGAAGVSLAAQRRVLVLHSMLTLREIQETAGKHDVDRVMHMLGWLPSNGLAAQEAYTRGFLEGQKRFLPVVERVQRLARALLADSDVARNLAADLGMTVAEQCVVVVVRVPFAVGERAQFVNALLERHHVPMTWHEQRELVAVVPDASRGLLLVQDFAQLLERPCAVGAATGRLGALGAAASLARRVSRVAPAERMPRRLPAVDDLFVEFAVAQTPEVGDRLRELAQRLATGPDLIATLAAYYQHDMNRMNTAGALRIHPRTLDYRLRRVRTLVGIDPASTRGVRTLSTTVACVQAGLWD